MIEILCVIGGILIGAIGMFFVYRKNSKKFEETEAELRNKLREKI